MDRDLETSGSVEFNGVQEGVVDLGPGPTATKRMAE